jgi:hypothetical protein
MDQASEREIARLHVILKAHYLPLLDGLFYIEMYNNSGRSIGPGPAGRLIDPSEAFPEATDAELEEGLKKVDCLLGWSYKLGDAALDRNLECFEQLHMQFLAENPGFREKTYSEVVGYGCMQAR